MNSPTLGIAIIGAGIGAATLARELGTVRAPS
jgi:hypothetical protein